MNKYGFDFLISILGTIASILFGGWSMMLQILLILMCMDYITGIMAAAIFKKSKKTKTGKLSSKAGFKGLLKKVFMLFICSMAYYIDTLMNAQNVVFTMVVLFYCSNEALSIMENAILMEIPIPDKLQKAIESLKEDNDHEC